MSKNPLVPKTYHPHMIGAFKKTSKSAIEAFSTDISVDMTAMKEYNTDKIARVTTLTIDRDEEGDKCFIAQKSLKGGKLARKPIKLSELFWWSMEQHPRADQKPVRQ